MSTFEEQFGHLKETDPIAYYDLKSNPCGVDSDSTGTETLLAVLLAVGLCFLAAIII